jgi:hypothetical protein
VAFGHTGGTIDKNTDHCHGKGRWRNDTFQNATCVPFCLFNVKVCTVYVPPWLIAASAIQSSDLMTDFTIPLRAYFYPSYLQVDVGEHHDLSASTAPEHVQAKEKCVRRLTELSKTGIAIPELLPKKQFTAVYRPLRCALAASTGHWLPVDWLGTLPPTPPPSPPATLPPSPPPSPPGPPTPKPAPVNCQTVLKMKCPLPFKTYDDCLACTRANASSPICKPKERQAYCNSTSI